MWFFKISVPNLSCNGAWVGQSFLFRTPCGILARFKYGCPWLRHPHSVASSVVPWSTFLSREWEQGIVLKTWGHVQHLDLLGPRPQTPVVAHCRRPVILLVSFRPLQPANSRPFPLLISVLSVLAASVFCGDQELPRAYLQISTALLKMLKKYIFKKEGRGKKRQWKLMVLHYKSLSSATADIPNLYFSWNEAF